MKPSPTYLANDVLCLEPRNRGSEADLDYYLKEPGLVVELLKVDEKLIF